MIEDKRLYQIALTQIKGVGSITSRHLLREVGDVEAIFKSSRKSLTTIQGIGSFLASEILNSAVLLKAEKELAFVDKNNLEMHFVDDDTYPKRLVDCSDAPILLYFKGKTDFNKRKVISIVGTRNATNYGSEFCNAFLGELSKNIPDLLVVSGLAYGIDICAHRAALEHNLPTVGVLAHGLDRIYPAEHRHTAVEMLEQGGLLTEFTSGTQPDKFNFVMRNRIVAGMADATIVIESKDRGGALITADIASSYCRDVFALPGRINDSRSAGCNKLIEQHKAGILLSAKQFLLSMNWDSTQQSKPKQQKLFFDLSSDEQQIVDKLNEKESLHIDQLAKELNTPVFQLFSTLLELEMKGIIRTLPGSLYTI